MTEGIIEAIINFFRDSVPDELIIFVISLLPVLELRGGLIAASLLDVNLIKAFIICFIGNMLPVPFILLFIRRIFKFLKTKKRIGKHIISLENRSLAKKNKVLKYRGWGLLLFVAIPIPGTGAWTGALVAALLKLRIRNSTLIIAVGVLIAGIIVSLISYGIPAIISNI